jgi:hypothetical protein
MAWQWKRSGSDCRALCGVALGALAWLLGPFAADTPAVSAEDNRLLTRMVREGQSPEVRAGAAAVMGNRRAADGRPVLEDALADRHPSVRAAAANALGRIGSAESLPPLRDVARDRVPRVATEVRDAIHNIELKKPLSEPQLSAASIRAARLGFLLGEMRNQSSFPESSLTTALGVAIERQLRAVPGVLLFAAEQQADVHAAMQRGVSVFRLDAAVTRLSTVTLDGQLTMHGEVALLVMDRPTGSLRTLFKGAARSVELPFGKPAQQKVDLAQRVVAAAVRSALRNAETSLPTALR